MLKQQRKTLHQHAVFPALPEPQAKQMQENQDQEQRLQGVSSSLVNSEIEKRYMCSAAKSCGLYTNSAQNAGDPDAELWSQGYEGGQVNGSEILL